MVLPTRLKFKLGPTGNNIILHVIFKSKYGLQIRSTGKSSQQSTYMWVMIKVCGSYCNVFLLINQKEEWHPTPEKKPFVFYQISICSGMSLRAGCQLIPPTEKDPNTGSKGPRKQKHGVI